MIDLSNIPQEMKDLQRWMLWNLELRRGENKPTKVPKQPNRLPASSNKPATWTTIEEAASAYSHGGFNGIGFALGDGIVGIDLDSALDESRNPLPWAAKIIEALVKLQTYIEVSPSGTGLHVYVKGTLPPNVKKKVRFGDESAGGREAVEVYDKGRYFTVTGDAFTASRDIKHIEDFRFILPDEMFREERAMRPVFETAESIELPDEEILKLATSSHNARGFVDLWNATADVNQSDGDFQLCCRLSFWTGRNASQMDRLFRRSKRMRPKWDSRRGDKTYGMTTIEKAIQLTVEIYKPSLALLTELVQLGN